VIVAHHAGEHLLLLLAGSGASAGPLLLVVWRTRLGRLADRMRRQ
jgi:hypothetical protein